MKTAIIANPTAGNGRGRRWAEALERALRDRGLEVTLHITARAGDGQRAAGTVDAGCIAVVGGDGTVNEALNGLGERRVCLAILPAGSANVVARELHFPRQPEILAAWIAAGRTRPMDLLKCGERRVVLGGGAGFDAAVAARVKESRGERSGLSQWVIPVIRTAIDYDYPMTRVIVDGKEICDRSPYVVVGNCPCSAGRFRATPKAKIDDGLLDVIAVKQFNLWKIFTLAAASWSPNFTERKDLVYAQGRHVLLEPVGSSSAPLQLDGDPAGTTPAAFNVLLHALTMLAPP